MKINTSSLNLNKLLWFIGIITFPFYFFPSGGIQISTLFLLLASLSSISKTNSYHHKVILTKTTPLFIFVIYSFVISITWIIITKDYNIITFPLMYAFNYFILYSLAIELVRNQSFITTFVYAVLASLLFQFFSSINITYDTTRGSLFFNNPNQLGYYSLISACLITVFVKKGYISSITFFIFMIMCIWLGQISLSKAVMVSSLLLLLYGTFSNYKIQLLTLLTILVVTTLMPDDLIVYNRLDAVIDRVSKIGVDNDDSAEGRGYDRILNHPYNLILGGAEGAYSRWDSYIKGSELHSTWGNILFSYGIIGSLCWLIFIKRLITTKEIVIIIVIGTLFLYGLTHNGIRFTLFWIFLSFLVYEESNKTQHIIQ